MAAELEVATASVSTIKSSLDSNEEELGHLFQAHKLGDDNVKELKKTLDASLARNVVLGAGNEGSCRVT